MSRFADNEYLRELPDVDGNVEIDAHAAALAILACTEIRGWATGCDPDEAAWLTERADVVLAAFGALNQANEAVAEVLAQGGERS